MVRAPYPARIAAGLLVTAIEETRKLPTLVFTLPMTAVSETLQAGMRLQQNIAELAIKGDGVLEMLFDKPAEQPEWARFDDDELLAPDEDHYPHPAADVERSAETDEPEHIEPGPVESEADEPEAAGRFALYSSTPQTAAVAQGNGTASESVAEDTGEVPESVVELDYDTLTLAQLRAKIRTLGLTELEDLAAYERANKGRAPFITMLDNRISAKAK